MYSGPKASIFINGKISNYFPLFRGARQGCSLSPLFIIALEPFLTKIRQDTHITCFQLSSTHVKLSVYADDILLYCSNPSTSLPFFLNQATSFSNLSGYRLNLDKCKVLPLNVLCVRQDFSCTSFSWNHAKIKYLGLWFSSNISESLKLNFDHILKTLSHSIERWHPLFLSWCGRLDSIKMMLSPLILFFLSMIPVHIPGIYF